MIDQEEKDLFAETVRRVYETADPSAVDDGLAEVGWRDALDAWGGTAVGVVLGEQGRACGTSGALEDVLAAALGVDPADAVVLPALDSHAPPGCVHDGHLAVRGTGSSRLLERPYAVVVTDAPSGPRAVRVPTDSLQVQTVTGLDPEAHLVLVSSDAVTLAAESGEDVDWSRALALGRLALACELVGVGRGMLALATEHALSRVQFGRTIGSFQAVRHRLVDAFLALEAADAAAEACAEAVGRREGPWTLSPSHAAMTKALAGRGVRTAARHCQQVLAGIGFTAEHPFHRYARRAILLDQQLGSHRALTRETGVATLHGGRVPFHLPL